MRIMASLLFLVWLIMRYWMHAGTFKIVYLHKNSFFSKYFHHRERFLALCDKRVPWNNIVMMRDITLAKLPGITGERLYNKAQDFVYDEILFQYCMHPGVIYHQHYQNMNLTKFYFRSWITLNVSPVRIFVPCTRCSSTNPPIRAP